MGSLTSANMIMIILLIVYIQYATLTVPSLALMSDGMSIINNYDPEKGVDSTELLGFVRCEQEMRHLFEEWMVTYDKSYNTLQERQRRLSIFKDNLRLIDEHNRPSNNHTFILGLNHFADLTNEEFRSTYLNSQSINVTHHELMLSMPTSDHRRQHVGRRRGRRSIPESVDWRDNGAVTQVKSQGSCGCCWAFAGIATVESLNYIVRGDLITLSEQQLVDCAGECTGRYVREGYAYIQRNGGIDTDQNYPYVSGSTGTKGTCKADLVNVVSIDDYSDFWDAGEEYMAEVVAVAPAAAGIMAGSDKFRFYSSGVITGECTSELNHAGALVGYGETKEQGKPPQEYWIFKNSWSSDWGENGYARVLRNNPTEPYGTCGIASYVTYPKINLTPAA
ncbi:hypothetical protein Taro_010649 [Colocasia esculenta]|uniref:Uncharacterized protein n=1 Tax=Colocasia esculenta TaxID=4460 RepID=A0A843U7I7_COLES|nr:hypothetical protein [Colocasia esculenta]